MSLRLLVRSFLVTLSVLVVILAPIVHEDGPLWIVAVAATLTVYFGMTARAVYAVSAVLLATDMAYGGDVGSVSIAYIGAVLMTLFLRRFIAMPAWARQDGWRVTDAIRTVVLAWWVCSLTVVLSILIGDALYGYGQPWARIMGLVSVRYAVQPAVIAVMVSVVVRRMAIPFRRAILFGI